MHPAAMSWVATHAPAAVASVVDVGGRDINGTVRACFPGALYTSVDLIDGPAVDVVADFADWEPDVLVDVVVCCEVAEHAESWRDLLAHAASILVADGTLIFTAAGPGRAPHSAFDGGELRDGEWYENIDPDALTDHLVELFGDVTVETNPAIGDVYAVATGRPKKARKRS